MNHHQARTHAEQLVDLCRELGPAAMPNTTARRELARLIRLKWRAESELFGLRSEFADVIERAERAERALDAFASQRRVRAGLALGRMADWLRVFGRRK
jgi:hypothetical protein